MLPSSTIMVHLVPQASHLLLTVKPFCVFFGLSMASPESARAATVNGRLGQPPTLLTAPISSSLSHPAIRIIFKIRRQSQHCPTIPRDLPVTTSLENAGLVARRAAPGEFAQRTLHFHTNKVQQLTISHNNNRSSNG